MNKILNKLNPVFLCSFLMVLFLSQNTVADSIDLIELQSSNYTDVWKTGDPIEIVSRATGIRSNNPYFWFDDTTLFSLSGTPDNKGTYTGSISVGVPGGEDLTYFSANFDEMYIFGDSTSWYSFVISNFSDIEGIIAPADLTINASVRVFKGRLFGTISGEGLKIPISAANIIPNPEPATLMLFGFGLLGIAGFGRKRSTK